jgi:ribosome biogenesis GTPase
MSDRHSLHLPVITANDPPSELVGTVISTQANFYLVQLDILAAAVQSDSVQIHPADYVDEPANCYPRQLLCTRRARLKKTGHQVLVGDRVLIEEPDWQGQRGAIAQIFPRQTELDRPPVANADHLLLVFALAEPTLDLLQLSRFLVKAESTQLDVTLCLNKCDLLSAQAQADLVQQVQRWGYNPIVISTQTQENLAEVYDSLRDRTTVISGPSGVGKSSLINSLIPKLELRVGAVSGKLGRGRHTTRHVELFELTHQGRLADTPGFNQPDLTCIASELIYCFPEIRQRLAHHPCQFSNCLHRDEPNCAVRGDWPRYEHYRIFLEEVLALETAQERSGEEESTTKLKTGDEGQWRHEPKLSTKRYRRSSRHTERQSLHNLHGNWKDLVLDDD